MELIDEGGGGGGGGEELKGSAADAGGGGGGGGRESPVELGVWGKEGTEGGGTAMPKLVLCENTTTQC